ncbi:cytochrome c oxidase, Cbb3-type, subunit III [Trichinella spiralis]|uniref:cytochrome c oxidase, Cbb3-type, subunit III n=1 Tax=Trichinella spiralis TaxID=6334 RepID=UPI0001EFD8F2|nr:cytochrome c oxidase, Cbb3-type, subunit III [Trichinella spiralis]
MKLLAACFVCGSDDGGGSPRQAKDADLLDQDSAGSSLYGALFADIQNTVHVSGHIAIVPARRVRRNRGQLSTGWIPQQHHAVSDWIHFVWWAVMKRSPLLQTSAPVF